MKNTIKILTIFICSILVICSLQTKSFADDKNLSDLLGLGKDFIDNGENQYIQEQPLNEEKLQSTSNYIYNILLAIGIVVALVIGIVIGIKMIFGAVEEKAKIKEALVPYIIGCIIVFGAFTIWKQIINMGNAIENSIESSQGSSATSGAISGAVQGAMQAIK